MSPRPQPLFADALSGANGMADPPPDRLAEVTFADALLAPFDDSVGGATPRVVLPEVPLPPSATELMTDRVAVEPPRKSAPKPALEPTRKPARAAAVPPMAAPAGPEGHRSTARQDRIDAYAAFLSPQIPQVAAPPPGMGRHGTAQIVRPVPGDVPYRAPQHRPTPRPAARPAAPRPRPVAKKRSRGGGFVAVFVIIIFLVASDLGRELLDVIAEFLNR